MSINGSERVLSLAKKTPQMMILKRLNLRWVKTAKELI